MNAMNADAMEMVWHNAVDYLTALSSHNRKVNVETIIDTIHEMLTAADLDEIADGLHYSPVEDGEL